MDILFITTLYKDIVLIMGFLIVIIIIIQGYKKYLILKKEQSKKYTLEFCFNDKTDYDFILTNDRYSHNKIRNLFMEKEVINIFSHFEKIAIGIKNNIFDEKIMMEFYGKYFILYYQYFLINLKNLNNYKNAQNIYYFIEYEKLAKKWSNKQFDEVSL
jgi:hypothetical protein